MKREALTPAEQVVARLDSYSQEDHADLIAAARERLAQAWDEGARTRLHTDPAVSVKDLNPYRKRQEPRP